MKTIVLGLLAAMSLLTLPFLVGADDLAPTRKLLAVPEYVQAYPLSCEAAATTAALRFLGSKLDEDQILAVMPIDTTPRSVDADGKITWGDPTKAFVGDYKGIFLQTGYGIYAKALSAALSKLGLKTIGFEHWSLDDLRHEIDRNHPVVVWVPTRFEVVTVKTWTTPTGAIIPWIDHEHAMVFRGYDKARKIVYLMDVHTGKYQTHSESEFLRGWGYLGNQALIFLN